MAKKKKKLNPKKIYAQYDQEVISYMCNLFKSLESQYGEVKDEWLVSLNLIATDYDIIQTCKKDLEKNGFNVVDDRGRLSKNGSISILNSCQSNLMKLLNSFGLNPFTKSKMKNVDDDGDLLEDLLS